MATDIVVPPLGESVTEATVARWLKQAGDPVAVDDPLVELETDKVTLEVNAPACLSQRATVASVTDSPSGGTTMSVAMAVSPQDASAASTICACSARWRFNRPVAVAAASGRPT